jgi:cytochrome oxidase Cu insertion factor (SCO1/SenC/PrrC family)
MKFPFINSIHNLIRLLILPLAVVVTYGLMPSCVQGATHSATVTSNSQTDYLPAITLINQDGKPVALDSLKGKPVLVSFIHASCKGVCELMTGKMKSVAEDLGKNGHKVTMVSITTDPVEDRPAQLKAYAAKEDVTGDGFIFLTGKSAAIKRVLAVYGVNQKPGDNEITHVFELFLIAPDGHAAHLYHGLNINAEKVAGDIQQTLAHG